MTTPSRTTRVASLPCRAESRSEYGPRGLISAVITRATLAPVPARPRPVVSRRPRGLGTSGENHRAARSPPPARTPPPGWGLTPAPQCQFYELPGPVSVPASSILLHSIGARPGRGRSERATAPRWRARPGGSRRRRLPARTRRAPPARGRRRAGYRPYDLRTPAWSRTEPCSASSAIASANASSMPARPLAGARLGHRPPREPAFAGRRAREGQGLLARAPPPRLRLPRPPRTPTAAGGSPRGRHRTARGPRSASASASCSSAAGTPSPAEIIASAHAT